MAAVHFMHGGQFCFYYFKDKTFKKLHKRLDDTYRRAVWLAEKTNILV